MVLDTDTYNEIDDQFARAYLLRSTEKRNVQVIYVAPFFDENNLMQDVAAARVVFGCGTALVRCPAWRGIRLYNL